MSTASRVPAPLKPIAIAANSPEYAALLSWPFGQVEFYERQIPRLLRFDIPQRVIHGSCAVWSYRNPQGDSVGFGTLDTCSDYANLADGKHHGYIPLLAVHPGFRGQGQGRTIVCHLCDEAALRFQSTADLADLLFLDVYTKNVQAIALYEKCGFTLLNADAPVPDPNENNEPFVIMARKL